MGRRVHKVTQPVLVRLVQVVLLLDRPALKVRSRKVLRVQLVQRVRLV